MTWRLFGNPDDQNLVNCVVASLLSKLEKCDGRALNFLSRQNDWRLLTKAQSFFQSYCYTTPSALLCFWETFNEFRYLSEIDQWKSFTEMIFIYYSKFIKYFPKTEYWQCRMKITLKKWLSFCLSLENIPFQVFS